MKKQISQLTFTILILFSLFLNNSKIVANIIRVPQDQPTIQSAINIAVDSDTILVSQGEYFERIDFLAKSITVASKYIETGDTNFVTNTIINAELLGPVVTIENIHDTTAMLAGFTIVNGVNHRGGGIYIDNSSLIIKQLIISNNFAYSLGGGIYMEDSQPKLLNLRIINNECALWGGGVYSYWSSPYFENIVVEGNSARGAGGIELRGENSILKNVIIRNNIADDEHAGGLYSEWGTFNFDNVIIDNNVALNSYGGGLFIDGSNLKRYLKNVTISNNSAVQGGGMFCIGSIRMERGLIFNNSSQNGSAIYSHRGVHEILNSTITDNPATIEGGIFCFESDLKIINSILWANNTSEIICSQEGDSNRFLIEYSNIDRGDASIVLNNNGVLNWGNGNIKDDPLFLNPPVSNYYLSKKSPCIDAGTAIYAIGNDTLLNLNSSQFYGSAPDIGAVEYNPMVSVYQETDDDIAFQLYQNYPNPFNPTTTIEHWLPINETVTIKLFDAIGREVKILVNEEQQAGKYKFEFNGFNYSSGIYFYQISAGRYQKTKKMLLLK